MCKILMHQLLFSLASANVSICGTAQNYKLNSILHFGMIRNCTACKKL
uniref:Uncharacterized protein n=1 Tax=Arundo donax TaxID=35708 RepID=A0A0A9BL42_ARUDO